MALAHILWPSLTSVITTSDVLASALFVLVLGMPAYTLGTFCTGLAGMILTRKARRQSDDEHNKKYILWVRGIAIYNLALVGIIVIAQITGYAWFVTALSSSHSG